MNIKTVMDSAKGMGDDALKAGRNVWLAGLGAVAYAEEEARDVFDRLVEKGESFEKSDKNLAFQAYDSMATRTRDLGKKVEGVVQDGVSSVLHRAGVPSREEILKLIDRVEKLTKKVEER